jgi:hypothetical protein
MFACRLLDQRQAEAQMRITRAFCLALVLPSGLAAQAAITGTVRDSLNRPIADVEVTIASPERRVRSDSTGNFTLAALEAGTYNLRARRIGYFPATMKVVLAANATKPIAFVLEKRPILLDTVQVTAACARFDFAGFTCRRRHNASDGHAFFFDVDAIDSVQPRFPIDMIRAVPGLRVIANPVREGLIVQSLTDWKCGIIYLANGKRPSLQNPLPVWPNETIGIEAYPTAKDVPAEYSHYLGIGGSSKTSCGLVNYWTVVRPRRTK